MARLALQSNPYDIDTPKSVKHNRPNSSHHSSSRPHPISNPNHKTHPFDLLLHKTPFLIPHAIARPPVILTFVGGVCWWGPHCVFRLASTDGMFQACCFLQPQLDLLLEVTGEGASRG